MNRMKSGGLAGLVATVPMTGIMLAVERVLCPTPKPLVNKQVVTGVARQAEIGPLNRATRNAIAWLSHFGYGAATGTVYGLMPQPAQPTTAAMQGAAYGFAVWAASYLGWLPAAGILPPATRHSRRRNVSLIASHLVWGTATAVLFHRLRNNRH